MSGVIPKDSSRRISVWRLNQSNEIVEPSKTSEIVELIHQEMLPPAHSFLAKLLVSKNYIVAILLDFTTVGGMYELIIEVRSTVGCNLIYTVRERVSRSNCFMFAHDVLTIQTHRLRAPVVFK